MEYERIILELLSRIKSLEEEIPELRERISQLESHSANSAPSAATYTKTSDEMIAACYDYGKMAFSDSSLELSALAGTVSEKTNMNRNSALMYIYVVKCMLGGEIYKRAISAKATETYFKAILSDYGRVGLRQALCATREHIKYRQSLGHTVDSLILLYEKYEDMV